jgi:hypothetical protein
LPERIREPVAVLPSHTIREPVRQSVLEPSAPGIA